MTTRMERMMKIRQDRLVEFVFCGGDGEGGGGGGYDCIDSLMRGWRVMRGSVPSLRIMWVFCIVVFKLIYLVFSELVPLLKR